MTTVQPPLATIPASFVMATEESWPLGFDTSAVLEDGDTPSSAVVVFTDIGTGKTITLSDAPSITGNVIVQIVRGSQLLGGHKYTLAVSFTVNVDTVALMVLSLTCPF